MTDVVSGPATDPRRASRSVARRPALDGMRAVAVYLVVAFHAGLGRFTGGFIGVDVFFVLSGYLVTQVLLRDVAGTGGIRFGRFYSRRVRRLLPASMVALVVTLAFYAAVAGPAQVAEAAGAFKASFLYVANWYFIGQSTDYFAFDTASSPVLHMWSLAVEEQFYLLWPLLFAGVLAVTARLGRRQVSVQRGLIALAAIASAGWALALRDTSPDRAYFGTDARAYQLLAGALLALSPMVIAGATRWRRTTQVAAVLAVLGLLVLAMRLQRLDPIERGIATTLVTIMLIVAIEAEVGGPIRWVLSRRPVVYLGQISYGTYLWHWPIIIVIGEVIEVSPRPLAVITVLTATGIASLSYHLLELPIRTSGRLDRRTWPLVGAGLALSVVAAIVVVPPMTQTGGTAAVTAAGAVDGEFTPVPDTIDPKAIYFEKFGETVDCVDSEPEDCTVVEGTGPHILLMGDSNASAWIPAFTEMAEAQDLTLSLAVTEGCPWQEDIYKLNEEIRARCRRTKTDAYDRVIPALDPDLVVVSNAHEPDGPPSSEYTESPLNSALRKATPASIEELGAGGREVVIIESLATPADREFDPRLCLEGAEWVEECRFVANTTLDWHTQLERDVAESSPSVRTADFDRLACPFLPICDPIIDDTIVFWNGSHIAERYSSMLGPDLTAYFTEQDLIPG